MFCPILIKSNIFLEVSGDDCTPWRVFAPDVRFFFTYLIFFDAFWVESWGIWEILEGGDGDATLHRSLVYPSIYILFSSIYLKPQVPPWKIFFRSSHSKWPSGFAARFFTSRNKTGFCWPLVFGNYLKNVQNPQIKLSETMYIPQQISVVKTSILEQ